MLSIKFSKKVPHAATAINGVTYSYDNNGNLSGYGNWTFSWDWRDRLTQTATGTATTTYAYDHENKRVWQKVNGNATTTYANRWYSVIDSATTTAYVYAGDVLIATIDNSASGTTTTRYIHPDHLNSTHVG